MTSIEPARIAALADRLDIAPNAVLAIAARAVEAGATIDAAWLDAEVARARNAPTAVDAAAEIALAGYGAYALDDLDRGLALVWSGVDAERP